MIVHGLIVLEEGIQEGQPVSFNEENIGYLADIVVDEKYRDEGLGISLMVYAVMQARALGFDRLYMRTLEDKSMSKGIALLVGFNQILDAIQIVPREMLDGSIKDMRDIFLEIDLRSLDKDKIEAAIQKALDKKQRKAKNQETKQSEAQTVDEER